MSFFNWNNYFETGVENVDYQHRKLIGIINNFGKYILEEKEDLLKAETVLKDLQDYTNYHFSTEESLMKEYKIDKKHIDQHMYKHEYFANEIATFIQEKHYDKKSNKILLEFLTEWLTSHILRTDQEMIRQYNLIRRNNV